MSLEWNFSDVWEAVAVLTQRRDWRLGYDGGGAGRGKHANAWPDLAVAAIMVILALQGGWSVLRQARSELAHGDRQGHSH